MVAQTQEVTGVFIRETFRSPDSDFFIGKILVEDEFGFSKEVGILGEAEPGEIKQRLAYHFYGRIERDDKYGEQCKFSDFVIAEPHSEETIVRYLQEAPHVGPMVARALWTKFRASAVRILRTEPEIACAGVRNLSLAQAQEAAEHLKHNARLENCMMELITLFNKRRFPKSSAREAFRMWGGSSPEVIKRNPHKLMQLPRIGWALADAMYLDLGLPPGRLRRQMYCGLNAIREACRRVGHTWVPISVFINGIKAGVSGTDANPARALQLAIRCRRPPLTIRRDCEPCQGKRGNADCPNCQGTGGALWIAETPKANAEQRLADALIRASREAPEWPFVDAENFPDLFDHQRDELAKALQGRVGMLTGLAGTGKTTVVSSLVSKIQELHGHGQCAFAAPTGKAAKRGTESMASKGLTLTAKTNHRTLGTVSIENYEFNYNSSNPLPYRFVFWDEHSMNDTPMASAIMSARGNAHYLFVGDPNQLPPIGHGAPLRDMLAAELPAGKLEEIHRSAGTIEEVCKKICLGQPFEFDKTIDLKAKPPRNFRLIKAKKEEVPGATLNAVRIIRNTKMFDPIWECQVIVALNDEKKSNASRQSLNKILQDELNPNGARVKGSPFRVGDKINQRNQNTYYSLVDDSSDDYEAIMDMMNSKRQVAVYNGEFGKVIEVHEKKTVVEFSTPKRVVVVPRSSAPPKTAKGKDKDDDDSAVEENTGTGCDLDLGYACTCHAMQGSEVACAIVILDESPGASGNYGICTREWFITGATRGKVLTLCVGLESTATKMIRRLALPMRKTFLRELLVAGRKQVSMQGGLCDESGET